MTSITRLYFCQSADQIDECGLDQAIIYKESVAKQLLHDANIMGITFVLSREEFNRLGSNLDKYSYKFPGYELEEAKLDDIDLIPEWKRVVERKTKEQKISFEESAKAFRTK